MKNLLPLILLLFSGIAFGQAEIVGTVIDSTGTTLPGANVVLLRTSDSLLTAFGTTDDKGVFRMQEVAPGDYLLRASFIGFERPDQPLKITPDDQYFGLGELKMYPAGFFLGGVEVTADRIPIQMRGDTMLYDAGAFGVSENAVVEDLLRRLPGMTVDASGQITWRGKPISEVMINGKPFFGGNTTLLTQNLDAKAVKNIQVYDQKTDNEEITGVDDGTENITVNLETKEEFKAKIFGDVYAGYGSKERYQAGGKGFRISDATQWGVLGTINNINKVGFSGDEISGFNSGSGRGGGGWWGGRGGGGDEGLAYDGGNATGQNRSIAAGLNFGKSLGKDGQLTADYALFDRNQAQLSSSLRSFNRENDNRVISTNEINGSQSFRHSFGVELRQKVDSLGRLRVNANFNLTGGDNRDSSATVVRNRGVEDEEYSVLDLTSVDQPNGSASASYNSRLSREVDRTLRVNGGFNFSNNQQDVDLITEGLTEGLQLPGALVNGRQTQDRLTDVLNYNAGVEYGEPISEKWNLQLGVDYRRENDKGDYRFRFNENTRVNLLERTWTRIEPQVELVYRMEKGGSFSFGSQYMLANLSLDGDDIRDTNFNYLLPFVRYRKRLEKGFFSSQLDTRVREPSITQLQTIARPSVSGSVSVGNPLLTPSQSTDFRTFLWYNDQFRAISGNGNISVGYEDNAFGNEVTFTSGQQIFKPINVSHAWNANINLGTTIGMNFINGQFKANVNGYGSQGKGFVDGIERLNRNVTVNAEVGVTTELNDDSYVTVGYRITNLRNTFEDEEKVTTTQLIHDISTDVALEFSPIWRFESRFAYGIYAANDFALQQTIPDLRVSLELRPFKKKGHYVRISGSDLFDQNTIVRRNVSQFVTTETTSNGLGRYFLATFFYKL